ncbi:MAG: hypothetical protein P1V51_21780 [Deltaproteobacteria bacterium]|nr:hypothetical protein [Deltaproteobacteria bacterium]
MECPGRLQGAAPVTIVTGKITGGTEFGEILTLPIWAVGVHTERGWRLLTVLADLRLEADPTPFCTSPDLAHLLARNGL